MFDDHHPAEGRQNKCKHPGEFAQHWKKILRKVRLRATRILQSDQTFAKAPPEAIIASKQHLQEHKAAGFWHIGPSIGPIDLGERSPSPRLYLRWRGAKNGRRLVKGFQGHCRFELYEMEAQYFAMMLLFCGGTSYF
jgi:hypothetical protein